MTATARSERTVDVRGYAAFFGWATLYVVARLVLEIETLSWWTRASVAIAPVPVFAWVLWNVSRGIGLMDELQRRIQLEALAFAFPITLVLLMTLGLLELAVGLNTDDWSYRHVWPFVVAFYIAGLARAKRRYE
jgi:hypothetical protein